jgi:hypothetical protein
MDLTPFLVGGAAARPDSVSGFDPVFGDSITRMIAAAPPEIQPYLRISSGYRSPERQAELYAEALKKYGSPEAARKWVALPGKSRHNHGHAPDLKFENDAARAWAHENAVKYGLAFPMSHEPWHVELAGARGAGGGTPLTFGGGVPAAPTTPFGIAGMFGGGGLAMGTPVDPVAAGIQEREKKRREQQKDQAEATEVRRTALLSGIGSMFG